MDTTRISRTAAEGKAGDIEWVESASCPGHFWGVNKKTGECPCPARIRKCRHYRVMRVRRAKRGLWALQHRYHNEDMTIDERCELREEILRLKRKTA